MLKEAINGYVVTLTKQWEHDRTKSVGASEIGLCARKVFWTKFENTARGVPRDDDWEDAWGARIRGTIMESAFWAPAMKLKFGDNILYSGPDQRTFVSGYISATPDALIINQSRDCLKHLGVPDIGPSGVLLAESKTVDPRTNLVEAKVENYMQTVVQMGLVRECTDYKPDYDVLTYTDASFWSEVSEFAVPFDSALYDVAKRRAAIIINAESGKELKPEGWIAGGKECSFCPFVKACGVERRAVPQNNARATPQFVAEISDYARKYNELQAIVDRDTTGLKELAHTIKERLKDKGVRRIEGVVNWYKVAGRNYWKSKEMAAKLLELGIDTDEYASVGEESDRLVVSASIPTTMSRPRMLLPGKQRRHANVKPIRTRAKTKTKTKTKSVRR